MRIIIKLICFVILLVQIGCTRENLTACSNNPFLFHLFFNFDENSDKLPINRGDIYIFDKDDVYVGQLPITNSEYTPLPVDHIEELKEGLEAGLYRAVSWSYLANNEQEENSPYLPNPTLFEVGLTKVDGVVITSKIDLTKEGKTIDYIPNMYTSQTEFESLEKDASTNVDLSYWQVNKKIDIDLSFIDIDGNPYTELADQNKAVINCSDEELTLFGRAVAGQQRFDYMPYEIENKEVGRVVYKFKKMTLDQTNTTPEIKIIDDNGVVIFNEKLFTILSETNYSTQKSLDKTNYYNIKIELKHNGGDDNTNTTVNISINGWKYETVGGDL